MKLTLILSIFVPSILGLGCWFSEHGDKATKTSCSTTYCITFEGSIKDGNKNFKKTSMDIYFSGEETVSGHVQGCENEFADLFFSYCTVIKFLKML